MKKEEWKEKKEEINVDNIIDGQCRICLCEDEGLIDDPLVVPCKCSGSVKYIHFKCLEKWLQSKCIKKIKNNIKFIKL